jgi:EmrB/QacA subfamily drug resistance transporter
MVDPHWLLSGTRGRHGPRAQGRSIRFVLPATILGSSLSFIDGSVVNVALPALERGLDSGLSTLQWVVNGYMLMLASLILLGGSAGDRFGERRIFLIGLIGFALASLACGLAPTAGWLIVARFAQGTAAALLTPASLAIIGQAYTGDARGPAIGTWAAAGAITTALGPPLGGWLVDAIGWRSIFFINLPVAAVALLLALRLPTDRATRTAEPLDWRGSLLAAVTLGLLSYGLIVLGEGRYGAGSAAIAAALPAIVLFIREETRSPAPMMPLWLFQSSDFSGANGLTVLLYAALTAALFLMPFLLIEVHGYSAAAAGAAFLPFSAIMGAGSRWSGRLVEQSGARLPLVAGPLVTAAGFAVLGLFGGDPNYWTGFLPGLLLVGSGMTVCVAPLTTTVFDSAPADRSGTASGINNAAARTGGLLAVAALGLAFGGMQGSSVRGAALVDAYRIVMFAAAALAVFSALVAAATIRAFFGEVDPAHRQKMQHDKDES